jgi:hypothetical protein
VAALSGAHASPSVELQLPFQCTPIPTQPDQLCVIVTLSPHGPFDDVVFYRRPSQGDLILLGSHKGEVATFGGVGFSRGGRYLWISWAEEGHPYFIFYPTETFLSDGLSAKSVGLVSDYYFDEFVSFKDDRQVVYALRDDAMEKCPPQPGDKPAYQMDPRTRQKRCLRYLILDNN